MAEGCDINKEPQTEVAIELYRRTLSPEKQAIFDQIRKAHHEMVEPGEDRKVEGDQELIEKLKKIENLQEYFENFKLVNDQLNVNNILLIHPKALFQMPNKESNIIIKMSKDLKIGKISEEQFNYEVSGICKKYQIVLENQRVAAVERIKEVFGVNDIAQFQLNGKYVLKNAKPFEVYALHKMFSNECKNYDELHIQVSKEMAKELKCKDVSEYIAATQYVIHQLEREAFKIKKDDPEWNAKSREFKFNKQAIEFLNFPMSIANGFKKLIDECEKANVETLKFSNSFSLANHYNKHAHFPKIDHINISVTDYIKMADEICSGPMPNPKWTQDGSSIFSMFKSDKYGAFAFRYDNISKRTSVIASLIGTDKHSRTPNVLS